MALSMERLSELNAVSGFEDEAREYLIPLIKEKCDSVEVDSIGNITAFKKGRSGKYKILIGTNIDEVGFIVSDITDTGFVKFKSVGKTDPRTLVSKKVAIGKGRIRGVIGMKAIHLQKREEREATVKTKDLYIDIGAKSREEAEKYVALGDMVAFDTRFEDKGEIIKGKALDRFGTAAVLAAADAVPMYDTYYVFSTQREIPCSVTGRGMRVAAYRIRPDFALVANTVNSDDFPNIESASARIGAGVVAEFMDRTSISDTAFLGRIADFAKKNGIPVQEKTSVRGESVSGAVIAAADGAVTATIAIPCRYSHTPVSYMNKSDIDSISRLFKLFAEESDVIINGIIEKTDRD